MFFWQNKLFRHALRFIDLVLILISCLLAYTVRNYYPGSASVLIHTPNFLLISFLFLFYSNITLNLFDLYGTGRGQDKMKMFGRTAVALLICTMLLITTLYILHIQDVSRVVILLVIVFSYILLTSRQLYISYRFSKNIKDKRHKINVLVIGSHERAKEAIRCILNDKDGIYNVLGCLEIDANRLGQSVVDNVKIIGQLDNYQKIISEHIVDEIIFALPLIQVKRAHWYITYAETVGVTVRILPDWQIQQIMFRPETASISFDTFVGLPTLLISSTPKKDLTQLVKSFIDYSCASCGLMLLAPVFLIISILIKLTSKGPVFFEQERIGTHGRRFQVYKFRTMMENAEELKHELEEKNEMDGPVFKIKNDPRITKIGRFLRKTSLDELPQLYNVMRGDMSLVGPRPPLQSEVKLYKPAERRRLSMKPGITCIWQVSDRNETSFEHWMKLDLQYIDNWSLMLDAKLLLQTVGAVFRCTGR